MSIWNVILFMELALMVPTLIVERRRQRKAPAPSTATLSIPSGLTVRQAVERTEGAWRWVTIQGVQFASVDDVVLFLARYADLAETSTNDNAAEWVRHIAAELGAAALDLDLADEVQP